MKRVTLASLVLATSLSCFVSFAAWAQQPGTRIEPYRVETTISHLCWSLKDQLAGTPRACTKSITDELRNRGIRVNRIPYGTRVLIEVKADPLNFTVQSEPIVGTQTAPQPASANRNLQSGAPFAQEVTDLKDRVTAVETGVAGIATDVKTLVARPASSSSGQFWALFGMIGICILLLASLVYGIFVAVRSAKKFGEDQNERLEAIPGRFIKAPSGDGAVHLAGLTKVLDGKDAENVRLRSHLSETEVELESLRLKPDENPVEVADNVVAEANESASTATPEMESAETKD